MRTLTGALLLAALGCATMQPGQGVDETFAREWGCSYEHVMERAEELKERLPDGKMWTPQVGWDACELMARNGKPDRVDKQSSRYGTSASWWWEVSEDGYTDMKLVSLEYEDGEWVVDYTGM